MPAIFQHIRFNLQRWCAWPRWAISVAAIALIWFLLLGNQGIVQLRALLHMRDDLQQEIRDLENTIAQLNAEKTRLENPRQLEPVIRRELGLIKPGEVLFELGKPPTLPAAETPPSPSREAR